MKFILFSVCLWLRLFSPLLFIVSLTLNIVSSAGLMIMSCLSLCLSQNDVMSFSVLKIDLLPIEILAGSASNTVFRAALAFGAADAADGHYRPSDVFAFVGFPYSLLFTLYFGILTAKVIDWFFLA